MYERYCELRDSLGYRDSDVAKGTGITKSTFSDWKNGRSIPKDEKLKKIALFLDTSVGNPSANMDQCRFLFCNDTEHPSTGKCISDHGTEAAPSN